MNKKVIIFDMDGVLFDTIPYAREVYIKRRPGMTEEMYNQMHANNFHEEAKKHAHLLIEETEEEKKKHRVDYAEKKSKTPLFGGIREMMEELHKAGYLLVLNTNAYDENCLPLLDKAGIKAHFDFVATANLSKDKVEKLKLIEDKYKTQKEDVLFVTDALGDVNDADIAEVPTVAVTWGVHSADYFEQDNHPSLVGIVNSVEELLSFIKAK